MRRPIALLLSAAFALSSLSVLAQTAPQLAGLSQADYVMSTNTAGTTYVLKNGKTGAVSTNTDADALLQSAVTACPTTGCTIFLAAGTYPISTYITLKDGITLDGAGPGKTIIQPTGNFAQLLYLAASSANVGNVTVRNIGFKQNSQVTTFAIGLFSTGAYKVQDVTIEGCSFDDFAKSAILAQNFERLTIQDNVFRNTGAAASTSNWATIFAAQTGATSTQLVYSRNKVYGIGNAANTNTNGNGAVRLANKIDGVVVTGNHFEGMRRGSTAAAKTEGVFIYGDDVDNVVISGNTFRDGDSSFVSVSAVTNYAPKNFTISNNIFDGYSKGGSAATPAVFLAGVENASIIGNSIINPGQSANVAIEVNTCRTATVSGNTVSGPFESDGLTGSGDTTKGIYVSGYNVNVTGNSVSGNPKYCYLVGNGSNVTVSGNSARDCITDGFYCNADVGMSRLLVEGNQFHDDSSDSTSQDHGILIGSNVTNSRVVNNIISGYDVSEYSWSPGAGTYRITLPDASGTVLVADSTLSSSQTLGPRGASADASGDSTVDNKLYPALRTNSGQPLTFTRTGVGTTYTLPDRGVEGVIVFSFDEHFSDTGQIGLAQTYCDANNIPCQAQPQMRSAGTYPSSSEVQAWTAAGNAIGHHGSYHYFAGFDAKDGNRNFKRTNYGSFYNTGTAVCTNGSATVTGTTTAWNDGILTANVRVGDAFACDWDDNGSIDQGDRKRARRIAAINSTTSITLDDEFDGTTNSVARAYEIRGDAMSGAAEIDQGTAAWKETTRLGPNYVPLSMAQPGSWEPMDDSTVALAASKGIDLTMGLAGSNFAAGNIGWKFGEELWGHTFASVVNPQRIAMTLTNCQLAAADAERLVEYIAKERIFVWANVEGVVADGSCTDTGKYIKESVWSAMLARAALLRSQGKLRVMTGDEASRYVRSIPQPQMGKNALRNYSAMLMATGKMGSTGTFAWFPGWGDTDADATQAGIQPGLGSNTTWTGDDAGTFTVTVSSGTDSPGMTQCLRLWPGFTYLLQSQIDCTDITAGNASVRLVAYDYDAVQSTEMVRLLDPVWYGQINATTAGNGFYHRTLDPPESMRCGATGGNGNTWTHGYFTVPSYYNEAVCVQLYGTSMTGTVRWRHLALTPIIPFTADGSPFGGGMDVKNLQISRASNTAGAITNTNQAFRRVWVPTERGADTDDDGTVNTSLRVDAPTVDLWGDAYVEAGGAERLLTRGDITADGTLDSLVEGRVGGSQALMIGGAITETNDTNRLCIRRLTTCNAAGDGGGAIECLLYDMDCDGTEDAEDWCTYENAGTVTNDADC